MRQISGTCTDASSDSADDCVRVLLGSDYLRIQPQFPEGRRPRYSDSETMDWLGGAGDDTWSDQGERIKEFVLA